jgi:hypothetical protein
MTIRFCLSRVQGRGAGLGNELIPWARSFLAAQMLGAKCLTPAFGMNTRRYWRHFGTPRYDFVVNRAIEKLLPVVRYTEADFLRHGGGDFVNAFAPFAEEHKLHNRGPYVLVTDGMWGGFRHIAKARDFVYSTLYQSRFAAKNLLAVQRRLDPAKITVGMHVRLGDFGAVPTELSAYQGKFNLALPLQWYRNIATSLVRELGDKVQFLIVSDGTAEQLAPLLQGLSAVTTSDLPDSDCSDLLALANTDLLVCSVSSFSATAAYLSKAPYLWFEPNLQKHPQGFYSIWGHEPEQIKKTSPTQQALREAGERLLQGRGMAVDMLGNLPMRLASDLIANKERLLQERDLIQYGVISIRPEQQAISTT